MFILGRIGEALPNTKNDGEIAGTVTLTPITYVGVTGDFNNWSVPAPELMTPDANYVSWSVTGNFTGKWKFIFNNDWLLANTNGWTINLGGEMDNLSLNGADIVEEASKIVLNITTYPWSCVVE